MDFHNFDGLQSARSCRIIPAVTGMYVQRRGGFKTMAEKKDDWENTGRFELRVSSEFLKIVDDWRRHEPDIPSRAEAIRRLVEIGAQSKGGVRVREKPRK